MSIKNNLTQIFEDMTHTFHSFFNSSDPDRQQKSTENILPVYRKNLENQIDAALKGEGTPENIDKLNRQLQESYAMASPGASVKAALEFANLGKNKNSSMEEAVDNINTFIGDITHKIANNSAEDLDVYDVVKYTKTMSGVLDNLSTLMNKLFGGTEAITDEKLNDPLYAIHVGLRNISTVSDQLTKVAKSLLGDRSDPNAEVDLVEADRIHKNLKEYGDRHQNKAELAGKTKEENFQTISALLKSPEQDSYSVPFKYIVAADNNDVKAKKYREAETTLHFKSLEELEYFAKELEPSKRVEYVKNHLKTNENKSTDYVNSSFIPVSTALVKTMKQEAMVIQTVAAHLNVIKNAVSTNKKDDELFKRYEELFFKAAEEGSNISLKDTGIDLAGLNGSGLVDRTLRKLDDLYMSKNNSMPEIMKALNNSSKASDAEINMILQDAYSGAIVENLNKDNVNFTETQTKALLALAEVIQSKRQFAQEIPSYIAKQFGNFYKEGNEEAQKDIKKVSEYYINMMDTQLNSKAFKLLQKLGIFEKNDDISPAVKYGTVDYNEDAIINNFNTKSVLDSTLAVYNKAFAYSDFSEYNTTLKNGSYSVQLAKSIATQLINLMTEKQSDNDASLYAVLHDKTYSRNLSQLTNKVLDKLVEKPKPTQQESQDTPQNQTESNAEATDNTNPQKQEKNASTSDSKGSVSDAEYQKAFDKALLENLPEEEIDDEDIAESRDTVNELGLTPKIVSLALEGKNSREILKEISDDLGDIKGSAKKGLLNDVLSTLEYPGTPQKDQEAFDDWKAIIDKAYKNTEKRLTKRGITKGGTNTPEAKNNASKSDSKASEEKSVEKPAEKPVEENKPVDKPTEEKKVEEKPVEEKVKEEPKPEPKPEPVKQETKENIPEVAQKNIESDNTATNEEKSIEPEKILNAAEEDFNSFGYDFDIGAVVAEQEENTPADLDIEGNNTFALAQQQQIAEAYEEKQQQDNKQVIEEQNEVTPVPTVIAQATPENNENGAENVIVNLNEDVEALDVNNPTTKKEIEVALKHIADQLNKGIVNEDNKIGSITDSVQQTVKGLNDLIKTNTNKIKEALDKNNKRLNSTEAFANPDKLNFNKFLSIGLQKFKSAVKNIKPLAAFSDFMSKVLAVRSEENLVNPEVAVLTLAGKMADKQKALLEHFTKFHDLMSSKDNRKSALAHAIHTMDLDTKNLEDMSTGDPNKVVGNLIRLFAVEKTSTNGNTYHDLPENIKTGIIYGMYTWLAENVNQPQFKTAEQINNILKRDVNTSIEADVYALFKGKGTLESGTVEDLGRRILSVLNVKFNSNTPENIRNIITNNLGNLAVYVMKQQGFAYTASMSSAELAAAKLNVHRDFVRHQKRIKQLLGIISSNRKRGQASPDEKIELTNILQRIGLLNDGATVESYYSMATGIPKTLDFLNISGEYSAEEFEKANKANTEKLAATQSKEAKELPFNQSQLTPAQIERRKYFLDNNFSLKDTKYGLEDTEKGTKELREIKGISNFYRGTGSFLSRLFGDETVTKFPTAVPANYSDKERFVMSSLERAALDRDNKQGYSLNPEMLGIYMLLLNNTDKETYQKNLTFLEHIAGAIPTEVYKEKPAHITRAFSQEAKSEGIRREMEHFKEFVLMLTAGSPFGFMKRLASKFFMKHVQWSQKRVGIDNNAINPQSSKFIRYMTQRETWQANIEMNDTAKLNVFKTGVLLALGEKPTALANFSEKIQPFVNAAKILHNKLQALRGDKPINTLLDVETYTKGDLNAQRFSESDLNAIREAVEAGGEALHSLNGLIALGGYLDALARNQESFVTNLVMEVDGVTNGVILSALAVGTATADQLSGGGIYSLTHANSRINGDMGGELYTDHEEWKQGLGHNDAYQRVAVKVIENIKISLIAEQDHANNMFEDEKEKEKQNLTRCKVFYTPLPLHMMYDAFKQISGDLVEFVDGVLKATKAGREMNKAPTIAINFGSAIKKAVDGMFNTFIDNIYDKFAKIAEITDETARNQAAQELFSQLNKLTYFKNRANEKSRGVLVNKISKALRSVVYKDFLKERVEDGKSFTRAGSNLERNSNFIKNNLFNESKEIISIVQEYKENIDYAETHAQNDFALTPVNEKGKDKLRELIYAGIEAYNNDIEEAAKKLEREHKLPLAAYTRRSKIELVTDKQMNDFIDSLLNKQFESEGLRLANSTEKQKFTLGEIISYYNTANTIFKAADAAIKDQATFAGLSQERRQEIRDLKETAQEHKNQAYKHFKDVFIGITALVVENDSTLSKLDPTLDFTKLIIDPNKNMYGDEETNAVHAALTKEGKLSNAADERPHINILLRGLNKDELDALRFGFDSLVGKAAKKAYKDEYSDYFKAKNIFSTVMSFSFGLFDGLFKMSYKNQIDKLITEGKLPSVNTATVVDGKRISHKFSFTDLSEQQKTDLLKVIKAPILTYLHTFFSRNDESINVDENGVKIEASEEEKRLRGMFLPKTPKDVDEFYNTYFERRTGAGNDFTSFRGVTPDSALDKAELTNKIVSKVMRDIYENNTVGIMPLTTHAIDSAISHLSYMLEINKAEQNLKDAGKEATVENVDKATSQSLNLHDARATGVNHIVDVAKNFNEALVKVMTGYSPLKEMIGNAQNYLQTMQDVFYGGTLTESIKDVQHDLLKKKYREDFVKTLAKNIFDSYKRNVDEYENDVAKFLEGKRNYTMSGAMTFMRTFLADGIKALYAYEENRLKTMLDIGVVSQYSFGGGHYEMTAEDKQKIKEQLDALQVEKLNALNQYTELFELLEGKENAKAIDGLSQEETKELQKIFEEEMRKNLYVALPKNNIAAIPDYDKYDYATRDSVANTHKNFMEYLGVIRRNIADFFRTYIGGIKSANVVTDPSGVAFSTENLTFNIVYLNTNTKGKSVGLFNTLQNFFNNYKMGGANNPNKGFLSLIRRPVVINNESGRVYKFFRSGLSRLANAGNNIRVLGTEEFLKVYQNLRATVEGQEASAILNSIKAANLEIITINPSIDSSDTESAVKNQRTYKVSALFNKSESRPGLNEVNLFSDNKTASLDHVFLNILFNGSYYNGTANYRPLDIGDIYKKIFPHGEAQSARDQLREIKRSGIYELNQDLYESLHKFMALQHVALGLAASSLKNSNMKENNYYKTIEESELEEENESEDIADFSEYAKLRSFMQLAAGFSDLVGAVNYKGSKDFLILAETKGNSNLFSSSVNGMTALGSLAQDIYSEQASITNANSANFNFKALPLKQQLIFIQKLQNKIMNDMKDKAYSGMYKANLGVDTFEKIRENAVQSKTAIIANIVRAMNSDNPLRIEDRNKSVLEGLPAIINLLEGMRSLFKTAAGFKNVNFIKGTDKAVVDDVMGKLLDYLKNSNDYLALPTIEQLYPDEKEVIDAYVEKHGQYDKNNSEGRSLTAEEHDFRTKAAIYTKILEGLNNKIKDIESTRSNSRFPLIKNLVNGLIDSTGDLASRVLKRVLSGINQKIGTDTVKDSTSSIGSSLVFQQMMHNPAIVKAINENTLTFNQLVDTLLTTSLSSLSNEESKGLILPAEYEKFKSTIKNHIVENFNKHRETINAYNIIKGIRSAFSNIDGLDRDSKEKSDVPVTIVTPDNFNMLPSNINETMLVNSGAMYSIDENGQGRIYILSPEFGANAQFNLTTLAHEYLHHHSVDALNYADKLSRHSGEKSEAEKQLIKTRNNILNIASLVLGQTRVAHVMQKLIGENPRYTDLVNLIERNVKTNKGSLTDANNSYYGITANQLKTNNPTAYADLLAITEEANQQLKNVGSNISFTSETMIATLGAINFSKLMTELAHSQGENGTINIHEFTAIFGTSPDMRNFMMLTLNKENSTQNFNANHLDKMTVYSNERPEKFNAGLSGFFKQIGSSVIFYAKALADFFYSRNTESSANTLANQANKIKAGDVITFENLVEHLYFDFGNIIKFNRDIKFKEGQALHAVNNDVREENYTYGMVPQTLLELILIMNLKL